MEKINSLEIGKTYQVNSYPLPEGRLAEWTLAGLKKEDLPIKGILVNQGYSGGRPKKRIEFMEGFFMDISDNPVIITLNGTQEYNILSEEDRRYNEFKSILIKYCKWNEPIS